MPRKNTTRRLGDLPRDARIEFDGRAHLVVAHWSYGVEVVPVAGWADTRVLHPDTIVHAGAVA